MEKRGLVQQAIPFALCFSLVASLFLFLNSRGVLLQKERDAVSALMLERHERFLERGTSMHGGYPDFADIHRKLIQIGRRNPQAFQAATYNKTIAMSTMVVLEDFASVGEEWASQFFVDQIYHPDPEVREFVVGSVGWRSFFWPYCTQRHAIEVGLRDEDPEVRAAAIMIFNNLAGTSADLQRLEQALRDPAWKVRMSAMSVLCSATNSFMDKSAGVLLNALNMPDVDLRTQAAATLVRRDQYVEPAINCLLETIAGGSEPRNVGRAILALRGVEHRSDEVQSVLKEALDHSDENIQAAASLVLAQDNSDELASQRGGTDPDFIWRLQGSVGF